MKSNLKFAALIFALAYLSVSAVRTHSQGETLSYAYITAQTGSADALVNFIGLNGLDAENGISTSLSARTIPLGEPLANLKNAQTSPDGQWLALLFNQGGGQKIDVLNLEASPVKIVTIIQGYTIKSFTWSPDSRYLSFVAYSLLITPTPNPQGEGKLEGVRYTVSNDTSYPLYLYKTDTAQLTPLGNDPHLLDPLELNNADLLPTSFSWSKDSKYITVANLICYYNGGSCRTDINLISIKTRMAERSVSAYAATVCLLSLSPDQMHVSFASNCQDYFGDFDEVFFADFASKSITQLTQSTNASDAAIIYDHFIQYSTAWFGADILLISVEKSDLIAGGIVPSTLSVQTLAYNIKTRNTVVLSNSIAARDFLTNDSDTVVFRSEKLKAQTVNNGTDPVISDGSLTIAKISDGQLKTIVDLPAGCNPIWSPNNNILAYENHVMPFEGQAPTDVCSGNNKNPIQGLYFINKDNYRIQQFKLSQNSIPAGWSYSYHSQSGPTPTAKPLRLTLLCAPSPDIHRNWRVSNLNNADILFSWQVDGTNQKGAGTVPAAKGDDHPGEATFQTNTVAGTPNTVQIFVNGTLQDTKASNPAKCEDDRSISANATAAATQAIGQ